MLPHMKQQSREGSKRLFSYYFSILVIITRSRRTVDAAARIKAPSAAPRKLREALPPLASSELFGLALFFGDRNQISFSVAPQMLHRIPGLINIVSESFRINVHPFKPITDLVLVLESQGPLAQIATFGDFRPRVFPITLVLRISRVYRIRDELPVVGHQCFKLFQKPHKPIQILHNPNI